MKKLLVINASARKAHSHSRTLTEVFTNYWSKKHPDAVINLRELGNANVPHVTEDWIAANLKPVAARTDREKEVLGTSDTYIAELREADIIVLGTPMYNWSIPSTVKAYIDQVMRLNETFRINPFNPAEPYVGLLQHKSLVLLVARGSQGYETGEPNARLNFQTTYLKTVFNMMGIDDIHMVAVDGTSLNKEVLLATVDRAHQQVRSLIEDVLKP
ncbi:NAD(P)H dehydrogenase [Niastella yeongjuensis]|uniref:FMN dependent NADH:quinone oxidoreductase n=1 Tax=Niastella yeongjuensis TaxID=354355 RepID=A0A1V9EPH2_9BACT|nr:NAD(P)H-dependent oxidoreductase [Niastella yeongjuensis]OQP48027.1 NAD(P)H dehydrogenase [Niastella yeongjuensis]SEO24082.1 FMN-dependent NADH-azoreductase [Niastella yeongjuensis]